MLKEVVRLNVTQDEPDDIDHLGNRRVRAVGELVQNRFRIGLARMERIIRDRMSTYDIESLKPNKLINARPVIGAVREFFMSSQLSQFMDQINPLAELEHKRRVSALGPGGLSRDRAGFEVRDVHTTHYGRICPIATPEGPNIGLVGHLASFAKINTFGFLETPYRRVVHDVPNEARFTEGEVAREDIKGIVKAGETITKKVAEKLEKKSDLEKIPVKARVTNEIVYLNSFKEERAVTASATTPVDENGFLLGERIPARVHGEPSVISVNEIDFLDVASNQILSVATSLIPFLEHDDATRALMGTTCSARPFHVLRHSRRLSVPVLKRTPRKTADMSCWPMRMEKLPLLTEIKSNSPTKKEKPIHIDSKKFVRSNASSSINQRPLVSLGQKVKKGHPLCDGPCTDGGELAHRTEHFGAYMPWDGFNYEDAIIISERLVHEDRYTSIHIEDYTIDVRETKLGPEVVTSDIPNVSEEKFKNLDSKASSASVRKCTPATFWLEKSHQRARPNCHRKKDCFARFSEKKPRDVRDTSLYLEHGEHGKVVDLKVFSRRRRRQDSNRAYQTGPGDRCGHAKDPGW